jgi:hypothetical protein
MTKLLGTVSAFVLMALGSHALAQANPERNAYFGETHIHTSYSAGCSATG